MSNENTTSPLPVASTGHLACEGWGCRTCLPISDQLEHAGGEQGLTADEHELAQARRLLHEAKEALGAGWLAGGVSLAEGIRRKTAELERLAHAEREACATAARGEDTHRLNVRGSGMSDWREGYLRGRLDAEKAVRARGKAS